MFKRIKQSIEVLFNKPVWTQNQTGIEIDLHSALTTNILKLGTLEMEACWRRIIVVQDPFVSGYECQTCWGKKIIAEKSYIDCPECEGTGKYGEKKCSGCEGRSIVVCPDCEGKGATIVMPDASERRPTTGMIASVGPDVKRFRRGMSVMYPSFAGTAMDLTAKGMHGEDIVVTIVILNEEEIMTNVRGHLELRRQRKTVALHTAA